MKAIIINLNQLYKRRTFHWWRSPLNMDYFVVIMNV